MQVEKNNKYLKESTDKELQIIKQRITNLTNYKSGRRTQILLKKREREVYRRLLFVLMIVVFLVLFMLIFGLQILVKIAEFLDIVQNTSRPESSRQDTIPPFPPRIDSQSTATNSARINISGYAESGNEVDIKINNKSYKSSADSSGRFKSENISLTEGENIVIVTSADRAGNQSQQSSIKIIYDKITPFLEIIEPSGNTTYRGQSREIKVRGKTEPESAVTVNDSLAIINAEGDFSFNMTLIDGENLIRIEAQDPAGNKSAASRVVYYYP